MQVLDYDGLSFFWQELQKYLEGKKYVKTVNLRGPDIYGNVIIEAVNVPYDNSSAPLAAINVQDAIDEVDRDWRYNAIYTFDATVQSAPPNLPRGYNWHVDMIGPMKEGHQYERFFYLTSADAELDEPGNPNLEKAVARWVIDGKRVFFEFFRTATTIDITNSEGEILLESFRPIPFGETWFFGQNQADEFPKTDNVRSIIDINVWGLNTMIGNTFDLQTTSKQIVNAINELNAKAATVKIKEMPTVPEALEYSQNNPDVFVFVARS